MIDDSVSIYGFTDLVEHLHLHHMYQMWSMAIRRFNESTGDMLFILHPIRQLPFWVYALRAIDRIRDKVFQDQEWHLDALFSCAWFNLSHYNHHTGSFTGYLNHVWCVYVSWDGV